VNQSICSKETSSDKLDGYQYGIHNPETLQSSKRGNDVAILMVSFEELIKDISSDMGLIPCSKNEDN